MTFIVVFGLIVVVMLVMVLVALGMRASRQARGESDDWVADDEPQIRHDGHPEEDIGDGYAAGYDRRVAGPSSAPLSAPLTDSDAPPRRGRGGDEMADDDYWATITFDKPKFPWQHDGGSDGGNAERGPDPLAAVANDQNVDIPAGGHGSTGPQPASPLDYGADPLHAPTAQARPIHDSDPLGLGANPAAHAPDPLGMAPPGPSPQISDPLGLGANPAAHAPDPLGMAPPGPSPQISDPLGLGSLPPPAQTSNPLGMTPSPPRSEAPGMETGGPGFTPYSGSGDPLGGSPAMSPSSGGTGPSGSGADTDSHRLPTVDELLQRIQSGRKRSGSAASSESASQPPGSSSYGSLTDPLNDPLNATGDSYGSGSSWPSSTSSPDSSSRGAYDSDPLRGPGGDPTGQQSSSSAGSVGGLSGSGYSGSGYSTGGFSTGGLSGSGYGTGSQKQNTAGSGQGYSTGDYPTTPAYGESPRYDDPLGNYDSGSTRQDYGSFSGRSESSSTTPLSGSQSAESGHYSDFTGNSSYGGTSDPRGSTGYSDSAVTPTGQQPGGYGTGGGTGGPGYYGSDQTYGQQQSSSDSGKPYGPGYDTGENARRPPEEWDNYGGDFRR